MVYEAVPDDVEIQKLTSAQRDALSRYKIHENINTFLGNENTPLLIGAAGIALALPALIDAFLQAQEETLNITLTDKQKTDLVNYATLSLGPVGIASLLGRKVGKGLLDLELPTFGEFKAGATGR
jgi:hypothetical protein